MAKISPVSIKYRIYAKFEAEGPLEKPDVIGALFGQTEGLLGADLEMRELQKEGKIGRIEVELETKDGETTGDIEIPSALDKAETTIIGAAIETIERIGPTDAKIRIEKIEDVRSNKRDYIMQRAKELLGNVQGDSLASSEMATNLKENYKTSKIQEYGTERLPAGDISGNEIIIVEGRADVINMLKNGIDNVIGMDGSKLPSTIKELSMNKEVTLFIDGDRGGKLIAKNVNDNANLNYVAVAPEGKEVEELTSKEILGALRKKVVAAEFFEREGRSSDRNYERRESERPKKERSTKELEDVDKERLKEVISKMSENKTLLLDEKLGTIKELAGIPKYLNDVYVVVTTKMVTQKLIDVAEESGVAYIGAKKFGNISEKNVKILSL
ncbi:MAG: DNA primase [Nanoarchaeota archaeon]|nr:DNA primase [Nanoarchaeota archaeon]